MKLSVLSKADCEQVRLWRNESLVALRTPYMLTQEQQEDFYKNVVCNREARARYWGITIDLTRYNTEGTYDKLIGMVGLENIEWENRRAEISIIINPEYQDAGYGEQALELLLEQGFMYMNLENIWGECYQSNPAVSFWIKISEKYDLGGDHDRNFIIMPNTKYYDGHYHGSILFNIVREAWLKCHKLS